MNLKNNILSLDEDTAFAKAMAAKTRKRQTRSLEYELIASLAYHQYTKDGQVDFESLLSIPLAERIPGLINESGLKRMHKLIITLLQQFCLSITLPKSKKLTETKISVCACDLILASEEDQLSIEDLILFFELAKNGRYGKFKTLLTHYSIMEKLEQYREDRYKAYLDIVKRKQSEYKSEGPVERISSEPTIIKNLFEKGAKIVPFRGIR
ncbi:MAG: hypothetical protein ACJ749_06335 [Flavisolibacter sp.]